MISVVQRVSRASVTVNSSGVSEIGPGLLILLGVAKGDRKEAARELAQKVARLRIFGDDEGRMNRSLQDIGGSALVVSQFTLLADTRRGRRPGFDGAAAPDEAEECYDLFVDTLRTLEIPTQTGVFGAHMEVELVNDGPVTFIVRSRENNDPRQDP
jgi:D-tyrosyl-tRNA(Tyr) deacylase